MRTNNSRIFNLDNHYRHDNRSLENMWTVYLLLCRDKSIYTGITTDIDRRFAEHSSGKGGSYTRAKKVTKLLYTELHPDRSTASKREAEIKRWSREKKLSLVSAR
jgi:putative endonuclease